MFNSIIHDDQKSCSDISSLTSNSETPVTVGVTPEANSFSPLNEIIDEIHRTEVCYESVKSFYLTNEFTEEDPNLLQRMMKLTEIDHLTLLSFMLQNVPEEKNRELIHRTLCGKFINAYATNPENKEILELGLFHLSSHSKTDKEKQQAFVALKNISKSIPNQYNDLKDFSGELMKDFGSKKEVVWNPS